MTLLLLQMSLVLAVTLCCGWLAQRLGQSRVVGEIIGGIALGPSLFGRFAPQAAGVIFPQSSLAPFDTLSTVGLIFFLFVIGTELNEASLRRHKATATLVSTLSMLLPFAMAVASAPALRRQFAPAGIPALPFTLLLGVAMSITAFPVLARILDERRLQSTPLGSTALLCAAVDDVCAWTLLAVALSLLPHGGSPHPGQTHGVGWNLLWLAVYIGVMVGVVRPLMAVVARRWQNSITLSYEMLGVIAVLVLLSATATDAIGVHPLFGAFLAGLCFPRVPQWQAGVKARLEMVISVLLLPFFFALTGMRTRLDLLGGATVWMWTAVILAVAVAGKMGGATLGVRLTGGTWRNGLALGALLNTRGLVELIVLNIAYKAGIFSPQLFSMMVVMALVTTMMTTPLLNALHIGGEQKDARSKPSSKAA
jgi:Kef-type K+ transport system membrane component KefB